jgi:hypothetical protein
MPAIELFIYTLSVYGFAWILTQSYFTKPIRQLFPCQDTNQLCIITKTDKVLTFVGYFLRCIVCTSFWIGIGVALLSKNLVILSHLFDKTGTLVGTLIIGGYCAATSWILGRMLGDAD